MSRFHDEFFRQGSPAHDALMIKSVSADGIKKILESTNLNDKILEEATHNTCHLSDTVTICSLADGRKTAWKRDDEKTPRIDYNYGKNENGQTDYTVKNYYCTFEDKCKHKDVCGFRQTPPREKQINLSCKLNGSPTILGYETEVIVSRGGFILGYADGLIKIKQSITVDGIIEENWTWGDFRQFAVDAYILFEAKPKITSIGEVIRQIKTYRTHLLHCRTGTSVITTYSILPNDALNYLKNEDIHVVVFEEGA